MESKNSMGDNITTIAFKKYQKSEVGENLWNATKNRILCHVIAAMNHVHVRESAVNASVIT
jgi:hypothetical protein